MEPGGADLGGSAGPGPGPGPLAPLWLGLSGPEVIQEMAVLGPCVQGGSWEVEGSAVEGRLRPGDGGGGE